jgi:hypothetical protein
LGSTHGRRRIKRDPLKEGRKRKRQPPPSRAKPEKPSQSPNTALTIEFKKHPSILREVEKLAEEEVRPLELQVIYILKQYLKNVNS